MKKILSVLIAVVLLGAVFAFAVASAGVGSLTMTSASGKQGDTVTLDVAMPTNPGLVTMSIQVSYDMDVLELTEVTDTGLLVGTTLNKKYKSPYQISWIDGETTEDSTATGKIASFTFKIKENAPLGKTDVTLTFRDSYNIALKANSFTATSGAVTVLCNHKMDNGTVTTQPTCTATGVKTFSCTVPGCDYKTTETIEMVGHAWDEGVVTTAPTVEKEGVKTYTCSVCKQTETEPVPKLQPTAAIVMASGSGISGDTVVLDVTMPINPGLVTMAIQVSYDMDILELTNFTDSGLLVGSTPNKTYKSPYKVAWIDAETTENNVATGTIASFTFKIKENAPLGKTDVVLTFKDSFDVDYKPNVFTAVSGAVTVACAHQTVETKVTTEPTCEADGVKTTTCQICGEVSTEKIDKLGHDWNDGTVAVPPSCTEEGRIEYTCSRCSAVESEAVPALGHNAVVMPAVAATCTETGLTEGSRCDRCQETLVAQNEVAALGHNAVAMPAVAPTCTETGLTEGSRCDRCQETLVAQSEVAALGHSYTVNVSVTAPSCTEEGYTCGTCDRCGVTSKYDVVPALGHKVVILLAVEATCTETGLTEGSRCDRCQETLVAQNEVAALGHSYVDDVCALCGEKKVKPGDVTNDEEINSLDGLVLMRYLNGWNIDVATPEAMDVNGDGEVNSLGGLILMRHLNGWSVELG